MRAFAKKKFAKRSMSIISPARLLMLACIASQAHFTAAFPADRKGEVERYKVDALFKMDGIYTRRRQTCSVSEVCAIRINDEISAELHFVGENHLWMYVKKYSSGGILSNCCYLDTYEAGVSERLSIFINSGRRYSSIYSFDNIGEKRNLTFAEDIYVIVKPILYHLR